MAVRDVIAAPDSSQGASALYSANGDYAVHAGGTDVLANGRTERVRGRTSPPSTVRSARPPW